MRYIYKYPFVIQDYVDIVMPRESTILHVDVQAGSGPCLWALVDPQSEECRWHFRIVGTGHPIQDSDVEFLKHIATFQDRSFVWHFFQRLQ